MTPDPTEAEIAAACTDAPPFDRGGDLATADLAKKCLALVESDQRIPPELWQRLNRQIHANAGSPEP